MLRTFTHFLSRTIRTPQCLNRNRLIRRQFTHSSMLHSQPPPSATATSTTSSITPFTRRLFKLPNPPPPPSQHHNSLPTFLTRAQKVALSPTSTVYTGTHYEYTVQATLRRFAFTLHRVGGRADAGVDLVGTWHVPGFEHPVRVFVQCKAMRAKLGPNLVRELEGSFWGGDTSSPSAGADDDYGVGAGGVKGGGMLGVLVGTTEATKGVRDAMKRSVYPMLWMMVDKSGNALQALWNGRVDELGLGALGVEVFHHSPVDGGGPTKRIALTWDGEEIPDMDRVEQNMADLEARWMELWEKKKVGLTSGTRKVELLDVVERLFPDEKPLLNSRTGSCSTLAEEDRERVLEVLEQSRNTESS